MEILSDVVGMDVENLCNELESEGFARTLIAEINGIVNHGLRIPLWFPHAVSWEITYRCNLRCHPGGMQTSKVDDEGVPMQRKVLIEKGILRSYFFDSYHAHLEGVYSTGNALRRSVTWEKAFATIPRCEISNMILEPGNRSLDQLIAETRKGVIIEKVATPTADPITGNFFIEIRNGATIENGEISSPIKTAILTGNVYDFIRQVSGIEKEAKTVERAVLPAIRVENLQLIG